MANRDRLTGLYECSYCHKWFSQWQEADACRDAHNLIYVPLTKEDLNRLIMFINIKDDSLITKSLVDSLYRFKNVRFDND